jgi:hypothetical protein
MFSVPDVVLLFTVTGGKSAPVSQFTKLVNVLGLGDGMYS